MRTRVVFIDALVRDTRTNEPITNLGRDDFQVFDNGKARSLSYFGANANSARPLALLLVLAPMDDRGRKSFQRPEILNSIAATLNKLRPEDEVGAMLLWRAGVGQTLVELTRDRRKVIAALGNLPKFASAKECVPAPRIIQDFALSTVAARPNSRTTIVMLTDSVFLMSDADRDELDRNLIRTNVSLNALITGTDWMFVLFRPLLKGEEEWGASRYDVPQYVARHTGGDYVRPRHKKDYAAALERLIGNLTARYTLGFTLKEDEPDDGQMHRLEVRVTAKDSQGKERKIEVSARQGYYLPK